MGKGGVGKSTLAETLSRVQEESAEVLLLRVKSYSITQEEPADLSHPFAPRQIDSHHFEDELHLHRVAEEFFTVNIGKVPLPPGIRWMSDKLSFSNEIAKKLLSNRFILKFIRACPGLTPTLFIGKICREAIEGRSPRGKRWTHIVVDAPSTGQALQLFESAKTLSHVLSQGPVHRFIRDTLEFVFSKNFEVHLMTLPEDGPLEECFETLSRLQKLNIKVQKLWLNRLVPDHEKNILVNAVEKLTLQESGTQNRDAINDLQCEIERIEDQQRNREILIDKLKGIPLQVIPEFASDADKVQSLQSYIETSGSDTDSGRGVKV